MNSQNADINSFEAYYFPEGQLLNLPRNRDLTSTLQGLERAMNTGTILEGIAVLCDSGMNLHIEFPALPDVQAMIPPSEAVYTPHGAPVKDIAILTRVGKAVCFKVMSIDKSEGSVHVTLSRRAAQAECMTNYLSSLHPGDILPARVTHMESFGAFVDIGCGISSLLSVDTISVSRISHPRDRLYNGQTIRVVVRSMEWGEDGLPKRIFVSTRELLGTWQENAAHFRAGDTVAGIVRSVEPYGVFVELTPNLAGLAELKEDVAATLDAKALIGRRATVFIKSILPERMKIKLVLLDTYKETTFSLPPLSYYVPESARHIREWHYSTPTAHKQIQSVFDSSPSHP